jgi:general secretion pathway protein D
MNGGRRLGVSQFNDSSVSAAKLPETYPAMSKMPIFRQLTAVGLASLLLLPPLPLLAGTRKGDKLRMQARLEEVKGNLDHALQLAEQAYQEDPTDPSYRLEAVRVRFEDGEMHLKAGQKLRDAGKLDEALTEFQKAYGIDPASDIAAQEIRRTKAMIEREKNGGDGSGAAALLPEDKALTPASLARKRSQEKTDSLESVPELRPLNTDVIDLKMVNQKPRILFETVGKLAGVNVLFDPEYDTQQTIRAASIDLSRTSLDQALDQLAIITKSFWKPLSANTIFVTVDNPNKRREYAEQVVKVFYLSNVTTPQEMQELLTVLRTVVDVQKVFSYTAQNALIVRAESDTMALVEKLISDLDKPRPEVLIDVLVMEVSSTHIRNITAALASQGITTSAVFAPRPGITTPGLQNNSNTATSTTSATTTTTGATTPTGTTTPTTGSTSVTQVPLSALSHISSADYSLTTLPGADLELVLNDSATRVLQSPEIRAISNIKASVKIGEKVPTATGSYSSTVTTVSPLVNTQFTYLDVGVNIDILPIVHENGEVSLHMELDVSQVASYVTIGGIQEPEIGQNKLTADSRLRDGEVNLIGGIIQQTDSKSTTGIPGLGQIPILGRLFSGENTEKDRTELVVALIPHVVRGVDITDSNLRGIDAGNATQIKVSYAPKPQPAGEKPAAAAVTPVTPGPVSAAPPATAPAAALAPGQAGPPATAPPVALPVGPSTPPNLPTPAPVPPPAPASSTPTPLTGPTHISFNPPNTDTQLGSTVTATLSADNVTDMVTAAAHLNYDPRILRINNIVLGDLPQRNVPPIEPSKNILNDSGEADMSVSRAPGNGGISGGGGLFTVVFQAVGRGTTNVTLSAISLTASTGQPINAVAGPPLVVNVR